jgi:hypothetical protein
VPESREHGSAHLQRARTDAALLAVRRAALHRERFARAGHAVRDHGRVEALEDRADGRTRGARVHLGLRARHVEHAVKVKGVARERRRGELREAVAHREHLAQVWVLGLVEHERGAIGSARVLLTALRGEERAQAHDHRHGVGLRLHRRAYATS